MARSPLFQGIEPDELTRIALTMTRRRYRRLEVIFHEGDPGDSLHIIVAGRGHQQDLPAGWCAGGRVRAARAGATGEPGRA
jgi:hypothetical protein